MCAGIVCVLVGWWDVGCGSAVMWAVGGVRCSVMCHAM